jgi:hypothetical protein
MSRPPRCDKGELEVYSRLTVQKDLAQTYKPLRESKKAIKTRNWFIDWVLIL